MYWVFFLLLAGLSRGLLQSSLRPFELSLTRTPSRCSLPHVREVQHHRKLSREPGHYLIEISREFTSGSDERFRIYAYDEDILWSQARVVCGYRSLPDDFVSFKHEDTGQTLPQKPLFSAQHPNLHGIDLTPPPLIIKRLVESGPSNNRIDLVFFSDGYTVDEYDKFIEDATRLALDVTSNQTFNTVKPLLNFWAAFSPSNESGIGVGGKPKDTTYGLYRDGTELRGVYYSKPEIAQAACSSMGDKCDYPILMGNDPFYGGLGGTYTVITPSLANGALVLRHELGHSIIDVGEEYDGGFAYFGVNAAQNISQLTWSHWLSEDRNTSKGKQLSAMPMQEYPWTLLNSSSPWVTTFNASGIYSRHQVKFSLSGLPRAGDLSVELDGINLDWAPRKGIGLDRWHYDVYRDGGLSDGVHEIKFTLHNVEAEGQAQLCSIELLEFGDEEHFNSTAGHYSAFPTFSDKNETSFRPTNDDCLMRAVTKPNFCKVCLEGLWLSLLKRVDLIDDIQTSCSRDASDALHTTLDLKLVPLADFRDDPVDVKESIEISWAKDGLNIAACANTTHCTVYNEDAVGSYGVTVSFETEEVRVDADGLLTAKAHFIIDESALPCKLDRASGD